MSAHVVQPPCCLVTRQPPSSEYLRRRSSENDGAVDAGHQPLGQGRGLLRLAAVPGDHKGWPRVKQVSLAETVASLETIFLRCAYRKAHLLSSKDSQQQRRHPDCRHRADVGSVVIVGVRWLMCAFLALACGCTAPGAGPSRTAPRLPLGIRDGLDRNRLGTREN